MANLYPRTGASTLIALGLDNWLLDQEWTGKIEGQKGLSTCPTPPLI